MNTYLMLIVLAVASFLQNMAFTWTSRSRNSGDPAYHRWAAYCSNGLWFACHFILLTQIWKVLTSGDWVVLLLTAIVYIIFTAEGSVAMMKILLKKEEGKRRVGANKDK